MKKSKILLILALCLSTPAFADEGDPPVGGKNCPNGQTVCREVPADDDIIKIINDWLASIFG